MLSEHDLASVEVPFENVAAGLEPVIAEHGFAVVTGVVPLAELRLFEDDFHEDLVELIDARLLAAAADGVRHAFNRFVVEGPRSFPLQTALLHLTRGTGLCLDHCLPHGRFAWRARMHPRVHEVFRALFPYSGDLVTSLGAPLFTPGGHCAAERNPTTAHVDTNKHDRRPRIVRRGTYQGLLYIWWPEMMRDAQIQLSGAKGLNYSEISQLHEGQRALELLRGWREHARRVPVPPGALLLWDQRTIHAGWPGGPRLAQAVCLEPAERRAEADRLAKLRLAALGLPGCHWASVGIQHDMCLGAAGAFSVQAVAAEEGREGGGTDAVVLPLKPCIRPQALAEGADLEGLQELVRVEFAHLGMWEPPPSSERLLAASVRDDFRRLL